MKIKITQIGIVAAFAVSMFVVFPVDVAVAVSALMLIVLAITVLSAKKIKRYDLFVGNILNQYGQTMQPGRTSSGSQEQAVPEPAKKTGRYPVESMTDEKSDDDIVFEISAAAKTATQKNTAQSTANRQKKTSPSVMRTASPNPYRRKHKTTADNRADAEKPTMHGTPETKANTEFSEELKKNQGDDRAFQSVLNPPSYSEFIDNDDFKIEPDDLGEQSKMTLEKASLAMSAKNYRDGLDVILSWMDFNGDTATSTAEFSDIMFLKGKCELMLKIYDECAKTWGAYFNELKIDETRLDKKWVDVSEAVESIDDNAASLPIMFMMLDYYRGKGRFKNMDAVYDKIVDIYRKKNDRKNLVLTYQNQLSVKKKLKNYNGRLHILDVLGKLYYDNGDKKSSRVCYQESIKLRGEMLAAQPEPANTEKAS